MELRHPRLQKPEDRWIRVLGECCALLAMAPPLQDSVPPADGYVTLVSGPLDVRGTACLQEAAADRGPHAVILDLRGESPEGVALDVLEQCDAAILRRGGVLVVVAEHGATRRTLAACDLQVSPGLRDGLAAAGLILSRRRAA